MVLGFRAAHEYSPNFILNKLQNQQQNRKWHGQTSGLFPVRCIALRQILQEGAALRMVGK
jgi:hypothetical protein